jgi:hypothetical protein
MLNHNSGEKFCLYISEKSVFSFRTMNPIFKPVASRAVDPHSPIYCKDTVYSPGPVR